MQEPPCVSLLDCYVQSIVITLKVVYILRELQFFRSTALNVPGGSPTGIQYCLSIFIFGDVLSDFCDRAKSLELTI